MISENQNNITLKYSLKSGTISSYYRVDGPIGILPERLSLTLGGKLNQGKQKGKALLAIGQVCGKHKKSEDGIYKNLNDGVIYSSIFRSPINSNSTGYFILDERHRVFDLWIINTTDGGLNYQFDFYKNQALNDKQIENCFIEYKKTGPSV